MKVIYFDKMDYYLNQVNVDIIESGFVSTSSEWNHYNRIAPFNKLYIITKGDFTIIDKVTKVKTTLKCNKAYIIPCNHPFDFICNSFGEKIFLAFNIILPNGFDMFDSCNECLEVDIDFIKIDYLKNALYKSSVFDSFILKNYLYNIISQIKIKYPKVCMYDTTKYSKISMDIFNIVRGGLSAKLTIQQIADHLNISKDKIYYEFKNDLGCSLKKYIDYMLVQKAMRLLLDSNKSIKEISHELEFNDQYYFSKFFKKHTTMTPKEYRNIYINNNN